MKQKIFFAFVCLLIILLASGCGRRDAADDTEYEGTAENGGMYVTEEGVAHGSLTMPPEGEIHENLALLGKVWGFVKYTHDSFITGRLDWDRELLRLVPLVLDGGDVRVILYEWFVGLGDDGYDNNLPPDERLRPMADMSWLNYDYLGPLAVHLNRFNGIETQDKSRAPVFLHPLGFIDFSNQRLHFGMDFNDAGYRLLGLFRLWNAMNYFFPHFDALDTNWNDLLFEFIPMMLEGTDRHSYMLTLAALTHHLRDGALDFRGTTFLFDEFGRYVAPVQLIAAEGQLVVYYVPRAIENLQKGDVIFSVNGRRIGEVTAEIRRFKSYPNDDKALDYLAGRWTETIGQGTSHTLRSHEREIEVEVLRGRFGETVRVSGNLTPRLVKTQAVASHALLDENIGLINPSVQSSAVHSIMENFAATYGIIVDLRIFPHNDFAMTMLQYLLEEPLPFLYRSTPALTNPGQRVYSHLYHYIPENPDAFIYKRPVVLLMDTQSFHNQEWSIMYLRAAPNVTVIGTYSMGAAGNVVSLPIPGGSAVWFTSTGVYTPEGGQTFRVGLAPDIRVDRTIEGLREGRDEIMEAAIAFILENR